RIVDVRQQASGRGSSSEGRAFLERLFAEASAAASVLLVVPPITAGGSGSTSESGDWSSWLKDAPRRIRVPCLCQVSPDVYRRSIARDPAWKGIARVIWLHAQQHAEIPWEL